ncbi:MAG: hypothetical protein U0169_27040 [Polyangiaceae bacterium]
MTLPRTLSLSAFLVVVGSSLVACVDKPAEGPAERAGKKLDDAASDVKKEAKDAKEDVKDAVKSDKK